MPPKPSAEVDVARLESRLLATLDFIESVQDFPSAPMVRKVVRDAAQQRDLRALRLIARDVDATTLALPAHMREGLEAILQERFGVDKEAERAEQRRRAAMILRRGRVVSEKERRWLEDYAEMLEATRADPQDIAAVREVLRQG